MTVCTGNTDCRCTSHKEDITARPIAFSVGTYGTNRTADVMVVQQLLNGLSLTEGGPTAPLKADGIVGPKTTAAINNYQSRLMSKPDGRIDPQGPTINALVGFICESRTVPSGPVGPLAPIAPAAGLPESELLKKLLDGVSNEELTKINRDDASARLDEVLPAIQKLRWKFTRVDRPLEALVQKHFGTNSEKITSADITHVQSIIRAIDFYASSYSSFIELDMDDAAARSAIAYTVRGGDKLPLNKFQIYRDIGNKSRVHKYPGQTIWLTLNYIISPRIERAGTVLHELAHFVGKRDGNYDVIDDYGAAFQGKFRQLSKFHKLHNAETFEFFLMDFCFGTDAITSTPRLLEKLQFAIEPPFVLGDHSIVMQR